MKKSCKRKTFSTIIYFQIIFVIIFRLYATAQTTSEKFETYTIGIGVNREMIPPIIGSFSAEPLKAENGEPVTVWASDISSKRKITKIYAIIYTLGQQIKRYETQMILNWNDKQNRYEAIYSEFKYCGEYQIDIYAVDEKNMVSSPASIYLNYDSNSNDVYESDNSFQNANILNFNNLSESEDGSNSKTPLWHQKHNFHNGDQEDWVKFYANKACYRITVTEVEENCDPIISIYGKDGSTLLEERNSNASGIDEYISWWCPQDGEGIYYIKISQHLKPDSNEKNGYYLEILRPTLNINGRIRVTLSPNVQTLIRITDKNKEPQWDASFMATTDTFEIPYPAGTFFLIAEADGYITWQQEITIEELTEKLVTIILEPLPLTPAAEFQTKTEPGPAPLTVNFVDLSTGNIDSWHWDFGNNTFSDSKNPSCTYLYPGSYDVSLTVSGPDGSDNLSKSKYVNVCFPEPNLSSPENNAKNISLAPQLSTSNDFTPSELSSLFKTQWQISSQMDFSSLNLDTTKTSPLSILNIPTGILENSTTYYWRVRYYADHNYPSEWSTTFSFTTQTDTPNDNNSNGIPDDQEIIKEIDLDGDQMNDLLQSELKCLNSFTGNNSLCAECLTESFHITSFMAMDACVVSNGPEKPDELPLGLFRIKLKNKDISKIKAKTKIALYLLEPYPEDGEWFLYDDLEGWTNIDQQAQVSLDKRSVVFEFEKSVTEHEKKDEGSSCFIMTCYLAQ